MTTYLFLATPSHDTNSYQEFQRAQIMAMWRKTAKNDSKVQRSAALPEPVIPPFIFNPLHDLESVWWLSLYLLVARKYQKPENAGSDFGDFMNNQLQVAANLFYNRCNRMIVMLGSPFFFYYTCPLHDAVYRSLLFLEDARSALVRRYREAEEDIAAIKFSTVSENRDGSDVAATMKTILKQISANLQGLKVIVGKEPTKKRARQSQDAATDRKDNVEESLSPRRLLFPEGSSRKARKTTEDSSPGSSSVVSARRNDEDLE